MCLVYQVKTSCFFSTHQNVFNTFNDTLTYYVYDADGTISAKAGIINLVNTATTTDDSRGGGGEVLEFFLSYRY